MENLWRRRLCSRKMKAKLKVLHVLCRIPRALLLELRQRTSNICWSLLQNCCESGSTDARTLGRPWRTQINTRHTVHPSFSRRGAVVVVAALVLGRGAGGQGRRAPIPLYILGVEMK